MVAPAYRNIELSESDQESEICETEKRETKRDIVLVYYV